MQQLPAAYSTLSASDLARLVAAEYRLNEPEVVLLRRAFNDNYRVTAGGERYILRVYLRMQEKYYLSGPDDLRFELELLEHLHREGVGVSTAIPRQSGELLGAIQAPEGLRYYVLFRYAPGEAVSRPSEAQTRALGEALARIHLAADRFRTNYRRHRLDLTALIDRALERLKPYLTERPADWEYLQSTARRVRQQIEALAVSPGSFGIIHGDPHAGNCHFEGNRPVFFDFDTCGYGWRVYDVGVVMGDPDYEHRTAFLEAYQSVRPMPASEVAALPAFTRARTIWDAGDILVLAHIWGEIAARRVVDQMLVTLRQFDRAAES